MARRSSTGPVKKKMPLEVGVSRVEGRGERGGGSYTTAGKPLAPPQPMRTMLNVNVAITKLFLYVSLVQCHREHLF